MQIASHDILIGRKLRVRVPTPPSPPTIRGRYALENGIFVAATNTVAGVDHLEMYIYTETSTNTCAI